MRCLPNTKSLHISLNIANFRLQTKQFHVLLHTYFPQVFLPLHFISATSPIGTPGAAPARVQILPYEPSIPQGDSTHPSQHHALLLLQAMQILSLHRPCFSSICQHTLDTSSVYLSLIGKILHGGVQSCHWKFEGIICYIYITEPTSAFDQGSFLHIRKSHRRSMTWQNFQHRQHHLLKDRDL